MDLNSLLALIWFPVFIKLILVQLYWWQIKEYRLDRFYVHLQTNVGKRLFLNKYNLIKLSILLLLLLLPYLSMILFIFFYGFYFIKISKNYNQALIPRPKFTYRIIAIFSLVMIQTVLISLVLWFFYNIYTIAALVVLDFLVPVLVFFAVILTDFVVKYLKQQKISQATYKIISHPKLIVIGITGSYGKTTTKDFIGQILALKYKVLVTPSHVNTDIGIANIIINNLTNDTQVLVVEMGAYKKGEIEQICKMVKPRIGVITSIGNQHLALFGSRDNLIKAKMELVDSLPRIGTLVLNAQYPDLITESSKYKINKILYSTKGKANVSASDIYNGSNSLTFNLVLGNKKFAVKSPVVGIANAQNILAAIAVSLELGLKITDILKGVAQLKSPKSTMQVIRGENGIVLIDDSYNINPFGVRLAIDSLSGFKKRKKIVVLSPMLELGHESDQSHREVLAYATAKCDQVFWIGLDFIDLASEFKKSSTIKIYKTAQEAVKDLKKDAQENTVILFEGKNSEKLLEAVR